MIKRLSPTNCLMGIPYCRQTCHSVCVLGPERGEMEVKKNLTKIGKAETSEIRLSGLFMLATAATISRRPSGYVLTTMGAKIKVNGQAIADNVALNEFDTIEIGKIKFQFYYKKGAE